jgi:hypothetical protein
VNHSRICQQRKCALDEKDGLYERPAQSDCGFDAILPDGLF